MGPAAAPGISDRTRAAEMDDRTPFPLNGERRVLHRRAHARLSQPTLHIPRAFVARPNRRASSWRRSLASVSPSFLGRRAEAEFLSIKPSGRFSHVGGIRLPACRARATPEGWCSLSRRCHGGFIVTPNARRSSRANDGLARHARFALSRLRTHALRASGFLCLSLSRFKHP